MAEKDIGETGGNMEEAGQSRLKGRTAGVEKKSRKSTDRKDEWPKKSYFEETCFDVADGGSAKMVKCCCYGDGIHRLKGEYSN